MSKRGTIVFWILFPIISILLTGILVFYLDLANGPLVFFIIEVIALVSAIVGRIIVRNSKGIIRFAPILSLLLVNLIIIPFAKPTIERKSAAYYKNPVKTPVLSLKYGDIQGVYSKDKEVMIYAGVPYAKAPVGDLRWRAPQEVEKWSEVKDCSYFAPRAMQSDSSPVIDTLVDIYSSKGWHPDYNMHPRQNMSEDCLYLNVWRPNNDKKDLPVLVYIHGGSLTTGTGSYEDYNGEEMAKKDVIMITIQYRLGVFGYFAHPQLIEESKKELPDRQYTTGNYGLLDQIQALKWINENIASFGGDKDNITIAGESAGSSSVSALCSSPLAKGLFVRAIGESSSLVVKVPPHTFRETTDALKTGEDIMKEMKCSSIEEMRKLSASKLLSTSYANSSMTLDNYALPEHPYDVYLNHKNNEKALLNGYNVLEADAFVVPSYLLSPTNKGNIKKRLLSYFNDNEVIVNELMELYKDKIEEDAFSALNEIMSVYWFIYPHHVWSNMICNDIDVYRYQFTKENNYHSTYHSGEMIYAYGNVKKSPYDYRYNESDLVLADKMLSYWSSFAKYGNPNQEGLETWNKYSGEPDKVLELGESIKPIVDKYLPVYKILDKYMDLSLDNK